MATAAVATSSVFSVFCGSLSSTGLLRSGSSAIPRAGAVMAVSIGARTELSPISTGSGCSSICATAVCSVGISATTPTGSNTWGGTGSSCGISRLSIMCTTGCSSCGGIDTGSASIGGLSTTICWPAAGTGGDADASLFCSMGVVAVLATGLTALVPAADPPAAVPSPATLSPMPPATTLRAASSSSSLSGLTSLYVPGPRNMKFSG